MQDQNLGGLYIYICIAIKIYIKNAWLDSLERQEAIRHIILTVERYITLSYGGKIKKALCWKP